MTSLLFSAAITAGGQSSRFGTDKALARWQHKSLLEHAATALDSCPQKLLIAGSHRYSLFGWQIVTDTRPSEGPLTGLEAALLHATNDWVAFTGVDIPTLDAAYWQILAAAITPNCQSVQAQDATGQLQPLAALYHRSLLNRVVRLLDCQERRLRLACPEDKAVKVTGLPPHYFWNINYPEDLARLEANTDCD